MTDHPQDLDQETPTGITFLRSTTTTVIDHEADGDTKTRVEHLARFAIADDALAHISAENAKRGSMFAPRWLEATYRDGELHRVKVTGPLLLVNGKLSQKITGRRDWGRWSYQALDRAVLPAKVAETLTGYETVIAMIAGQGR